MNLASRLESHGQPDRIHCSKEIYAALSSRFEFEPRGQIELKGKGKTETYFLNGALVE